ncbi:unnamed protein product [Polarella glacialis]|uniref:Ubiquitin-like domain-containing protein n=1 Tax=Polarella glacialis TaxID=89957 RepID=A0A813FUE3_POLGL|nr:unnamed protein product [Polarella glacialis]
MTSCRYDQAALPFDFRIVDRPTPAQPSEFWAGSGFHLSDLLGASLVTFDQHVPLTSGAPEALDPRAIYVQYQTVDPVTMEHASLVVPAQLSLDTYVGPEFNWDDYTDQQPEIQEEEEDEEFDVVVDQQYKLYTKCLGDPILSRAARPLSPDAYLAPLRRETAFARGQGPASARRSQNAKPALSASTLSSFSKAAGRDKFSQTRLSELDAVIRSTGARVSSGAWHPQTPQVAWLDKRKLQTQEGQILEGAFSDRCVRPASMIPISAMAEALDAPCPAPTRGKDLTAQVAVHLFRAQQGNGSSGKEAGDDSEEAGAEEEQRGLEAEDGEAAQGSSVHKAGPGIIHSGRGHTGSLSVTGRPGPEVHQKRTDFSSLQSAPTGSGIDSPGQPGRLRDLDPHVRLKKVKETAPVRSLYKNWPCVPKRQVATHLFGMTDTQILSAEVEESRLVGPPPTRHGRSSKETAPFLAVRMQDPRAGESCISSFPSRMQSKLASVRPHSPGPSSGAQRGLPLRQDNPTTSGKLQPPRSAEAASPRCKAATPSFKSLQTPTTLHRGGSGPATHALEVRVSDRGSRLVVGQAAPVVLAPGLKNSPAECQFQPTKSIMETPSRMLEWQQTEEAAAEPLTLDRTSLLFVCNGTTGEKHSFWVALALRVLAVKRLVEDVIGLPADEMRLSYKGRLLDEKRTLLDSGVEAYVCIIFSTSIISTSCSQSVFL